LERVATKIDGGVDNDGNGEEQKQSSCKNEKFPIRIQFYFPDFK